MSMWRGAGGPSTLFAAGVRFGRGICTTSVTLSHACCSADTWLLGRPGIIIIIIMTSTLLSAGSGRSWSWCWNWGRSRDEMRRACEMFFACLRTFCVGVSLHPLDISCAYSLAAGVAKSQNSTRATDFVSFRFGSYFCYFCCSCFWRVALSGLNCVYAP